MSKTKKKRKPGKILNIIKNIGNGIVKLFDKFIIIPITKLIVLVVDRTGENGKSLEKFLLNRNVLIILSLAISIGIFFVVDARVTSFVESSAEVLYNQPVTVVGYKESYVVEGIPESVDITLIGRQSDLYLAKQLPINEVAIDLTGLKPGTHKVELKYTQSVASIDYKMDPSTATIVIYNKESEVMNINVDLLNQDELDERLVIEKTEIDRDDVIIKGAAHTLEKVATVKALIDINNIIDPAVGVEELTNIPLIAYDESGNTVDCEIVPSKVTATITITSPSKVVPIKAIPTGNVSFGKAIDAIILDETNVTIYGDLSIIDEIEYVPVEIDVDELSSNKEYNMSLEKPVGVRSMSVTNVTVDVNLGDEVTRDLEDIKLIHENLGKGLIVNALSEDDSFIDIILRGTEDVLDNLDSTTVKAYIDLSGLGAGEHEVEVQVVGSDLRITYVPKIKKVNIVIE